MTYFVEFNGSQLGLLNRVDGGVYHLTSDDLYMYAEIDE